MKYFLVFAAAICAGTNGELKIQPILAKGIGSAAYQLKISDTSFTYYDGNTYNTFIQSELEYPLDPVFAGLRLEYLAPVSFLGRDRLLSARASGLANIGRPSSKMKDSDWVGAMTHISQSISASDVRIRFLFSYTESVMELSFIEGGGGLLLEAFRFLGRPVSLGVTFCYDHLYADIFGISGWQYGVRDTTVSDTLEKFHFDTLQDTRVLTYRVDYYTVALAASYPIIRGPRAEWLLETGFSPLSWATDEDYHLLRNKKVNSRTRGYAVQAESRFSWTVSPDWTWSLQAGFRYLDNHGTMEQFWYDDETYGEGMDETVVTPKGTTLSGIDARFFSLTGRIALSITYRLKY